MYLNPCIADLMRMIRVVRGRAHDGGNPCPLCGYSPSTGDEYDHLTDCGHYARLSTLQRMIETACAKCFRAFAPGQPSCHVHGAADGTVEDPTARKP